MPSPRYWREKPSRFRFEAGKCKGCGKVVFPKRKICPACRGREFEELCLERRAKVITKTVINVSPDEFMMEAPYVMAVVEYPEGGEHVVPYRGQPQRRQQEQYGVDDLAAVSVESNQVNFGRTNVVVDRLLVCRLGRLITGTLRACGIALLHRRFEGQPTTRHQQPAAYQLATQPGTGEQPH